MGVIYEHLKRADMEYHPLFDKHHITFSCFIDMLMIFTEDTIELIAKYLIGNDEFLRLDYYCAAYRNGKPTAILYKFDENSNDDPPSYPTKDYLQELIDGESRINDPDEYGWLVSDILNTTAIKDIGLNDSAFTVLRYGESEKAQLTQAQADIEKLKSENARLSEKLAEQASASQILEGYSTPSLVIMEAVIKEFWINYQSDQPAPKQSTITAWIKDNYDLSEAMALSIDKVCRHSSAKSGGKYKR